MSEESQQPKNLKSEVEAMSTIAGVLESLDPDSVRRVISWAQSAFLTDAPLVPGSTVAVQGVPQQPLEKPVISDLPTLFHLANPQTGREKALVVAYWLQPDPEANDFTAAEANKLLKELGHGIGNITREFDRLMSEKPQLVYQTRKSGASKQARKLYRITSAGRQRIDEMIAESTS